MNDFEYLVRRSPDVRFEVTNSDWIEQLRAALFTGEPTWVQGCYGYVLEISIDSRIEGHERAIVTIRPTALPNKKEKTMFNTPTEVTKKDVEVNKFYVGHKSTIARKWGHATLDKAIAHAKELVEEDGDDQIVVKIVRVVRREKPPIVVENVK